MDYWYISKLEYFLFFCFDVILLVPAVYYELHYLVGEEESKLLPPSQFNAHKACFPGTQGNMVSSC